MTASAESDHNIVRYYFSCALLPDRLQVLAFEGVEELNNPYRLTVHLSAEDEATDTALLLGRDATLTIERGEHARSFHGVVSRLTLSDNHGLQQTPSVEIVPAVSALKMSKTSRIFQHKTALEIVEEVLTAELRPYRREFDSSRLDRSRYLCRDYCVQYQETSFDFIHRLLEEEGVGYYFRHGEREELVLFDDNRQLPRVDTMDAGPVPFDSASRTWVGSEPIVRFRPRAELAPTRIVVRDHDWTRSRPTIEEVGEADAADGADGHAHELYEHGLEHRVTIHEDAELLSTMLGLAMQAANPMGRPAAFDYMVQNLDGVLLDGFSTSDGQHQRTIRQQLMRRDRSSAEGMGLVIGLSPGHTFALLGHPTLGADGQYLLTKVVHSSERLEVSFFDGRLALPEGTNYQNRFECRPTVAPWRPARRTRKPRIHGIQTAKVTGPMGMDVHTDQHGRIKVKFNWDRAGFSAAGDYTCWLRVAQTWAGHGSPGFIFLPRIGMEVLVGFVDGDPDRPLVTGCVYNGENSTPALLPIQATKSIIRTRTIPHGPGYNEISFEDAMGMERVHIRAQRDLDELVLHDHITDVRASQTNCVTYDQHETIGRNQRLDVRGQRQVMVRDTHTQRSLSDHRHDIDGCETITVGQSYRLDVEGGSYSVGVEHGEYHIRSGGAVFIEQGEEHSVLISSHDDEKGITMKSGRSTMHISDDEIKLTIGGSSILMKSGLIQINGKTFPASSGEPSDGPR